MVAHTEYRGVCLKRGAWTVCTLKGAGRGKKEEEKLF